MRKSNGLHGGTIISDFEYTYDDLSRIVEEKHLDINSKFCYTYDELGRVTARIVKNATTNAVISTETFRALAAFAIKQSITKLTCDSKQ